MYPKKTKNERIWDKLTHKREIITSITFHIDHVIVLWQAKYIDPQTKLYYSNADEFSTVRSLPSDIISGYLTLRGEHNPIG